MCEPHATRAGLRRQLRARRRALSAHERRGAQQRLEQNLYRHLLALRLRHVAIYHASDGELDPLPTLMRHAFRNTHLYLPMLDPVHAGQLQFRRWRHGQPLGRNRFGIGEPRRPAHGRALWALDAILMPLVGFDCRGYRLGMGGGFYDRALARLAQRPRRPALIGIAYGFQRLPRLAEEPWDQPMDQVITDEK